MKKGEKRKQELLQIAYRLFLTRGYETTSVDEIIEAAGIAKGTYYYYFQSKEQMLEAVIGMMIVAEAQAARQVLASELPVPQKIVGIVASVHPTQDEQPIEDLLNRPENVLMHKKIREQLLEAMVPLLAEAVEEGVRNGMFACDHIRERVKMLLILSSELFDEAHYTETEADVFVDVMETLLGAAPGTMDLVRALIPLEAASAEGGETE